MIPVRKSDRSSVLEKGTPLSSRLSPACKLHAVMRPARNRFRLFLAAAIVARGRNGGVCTFGMSRTIRQATFPG